MFYSSIKKFYNLGNGINQIKTKHTWALPAFKVRPLFTIMEFPFSGKNIRNPHHLAGYLWECANLREFEGLC
jgi:hypothetical protein